MKTIQIPGTDLQLSNLCFGPATFGALIDERASFEMLDYYVAQGGNCIDTAHVYCDWLHIGKSTSEKLLGRWMEARAMRNKVTIATKAGHYAFETPDVSRVTAEEVLVDIKESLAYLQTDCIDFLWLHRDNTGLPAGEILEFLNEYKKRGLIRWFGGSNWTATRLQEADTYARSHQIQGFSGVQNLWSVAHLGAPLGDASCVVAQDADITYYRASGLPLFAYTPQANGFFSKLAANGPDRLPSHAKNTYLNDTNLRKLDLMITLAEKYQCTINDIVLAYLTSQDFTCISVFNCSHFDQLKETMHHSALALTAEERAKLD